MKKSFFLFALLFIFNMPCPVFAADSGFETARKNMVSQQIRARGIKDLRVLDIMGRVERHRFVPKSLQNRAYTDNPLPIGQGQTISQPYIVALMSEKLGLTGKEKVLEIGTGSGYQAAVLAGLAKEVYTVEIKEKLHKKAVKTFQILGLGHIRAKSGDGYFGWSEPGPFDAVMITASVNHIPPPLLAQLKDGGHLILPLGNPFSYQNLVLVTKKGEDYSVKQITGVLFVPMTGHAMSGK